MRHARGVGPTDHGRRPELVDGRSTRALELDSYIEARWGDGNRCLPPRGPAPSVLMRRAGVRLRSRYGLVRCPGCKALSITGNGQATKLCAYCGRRFWLHGRRVLFQSDDPELIRRMRGGNFQGDYYRPTFERAHQLVRGLEDRRGAEAKHVPAPGKGNGSVATKCNKS